MEAKREFVVFVGSALLGRGSLAEVALLARGPASRGGPRVAVFDNRTGEAVDFDFREQLGRFTGRARAAQGPRAPEAGPPARD